jgi:outer membrane receptor protein involved in Fe transport
VTNVTLQSCPTNFPCVQLPGVTLVQRQNVGDIDAWGFEAEGHYRILDGLTANAAVDYVDAHVEGGTQAPQITGNRPAQAPRWTITGGFEAKPLDRLSINANLRYEGLRYADDLNKFRLGAAITLDARVSYAISQQLSAYLYGDNLLDARVATTASFGPTSAGLGPVVSYAAPLIIGGGFSWAQ